MTDLWLEEFFQERPQVKDALSASAAELAEAFTVEDKELRVEAVKKAHQNLLITTESMNLEKQLEEFDRSHSAFPVYCWARMYMRQVLVLLAFHRSIKDPNLYLYLASLEALSTYFFAYNRLDYAQNILEFVARTYASKICSPTLWKRLVDGEFASTQGPIPFTSIGLDQAQEHKNKILKGEGGIKGIANKPAGLLKYCLAAPELSRISTETKEMLSLNVDQSDTSKHHQDSKERVLRQERNVKALKEAIKPAGIFSDKGKRLHNLLTKKVLREEAERSILNMESRGDEAKETFLQNRICGDGNLWDPMKKVKLLNWDDLSKSTKLKSKTKEFQLKSTTSLFSRLMVIAKSERSLDLEAAISQYEFHSVNHLLMNPNGTLIPCKGKSDLTKALLDLAPEAEYVSVPEGNISLIVDGMAVCQSLMNAVKFRSCLDLGVAYAAYIEGLLQEYDGGRIIFDNYAKKLTLKDSIRYSQESTEDLYIEDCTPIKDAKKMLANKSTKDRLTLYLAAKVISHCKKPVVTVTRKDVCTNIPHYHPTTGISSQEEADTLMIPHAIEVVSQVPGNKVDFFTQDTDWWVLILRRFPMLNPDTGIVTGTKDSRRRIAMKPIFDALGPEHANALPGLHSITGCDTAGSISGIGKVTALKAFRQAPVEVITALTDIGKDDRPSDTILERCEEFYCQMLSSKAVSASNAGTLRWKRFKKLSPEQGTHDTIISYSNGSTIHPIIQAH